MRRNGVVPVPCIIVCSRKDSRRLPMKTFRKIAGVEIINHLLDNLRQSRFNVCLAIPPEDMDDYLNIIGNNVVRKINIYPGSSECPLSRMHNASQKFCLDPIIRVTHDKMFVDASLIEKAYDLYKKIDVEYLYSSSLPDGAGFEIISQSLLRRAFAQFGSSNVEHISYAIKALKPKSYDFDDFGNEYRSSLKPRFLIDYEEDIQFMQAVYQLGGIDLKSALEVVRERPYLNEINRMPLITYYTCAYNAQNTIDETIRSVIKQTNFEQAEYILIDDCSEDNTFERLIHWSKIFPNIIVRRNETNLGLSSSSNRALSMARGTYICRLDADDYFINASAVDEMIKHCDSKGVKIDACYPSYICEKSKEFQSGKLHHHIGGSLFRTSAVNHVKFTERLRGYEGLDFFSRARRQIKYCYFDQPVFFYRHSDKSLSNTNLDEREKIKKAIEDGITGDQLVNE